ncbi:MAG: sensor histidine kinase [Anaerolineae bacterium]|nr:sensor histidine kinase [Anaerolineae bacterium]
MTGWHILGYFFHGLAFFTLGLTVSFLQYRSRRVLLARRLPWLGAFAICEALVAWDELLGLLTVNTALITPLLQPILMGVGYTFLLCFGIQTFWVEDSANVRRLLFWLILLWISGYVVALATTYPQWTDVTGVAQTLSRYGLAFPGGVLTAIGLHRQSDLTLQEEWRRSTRRYLRLIEAMLAAFGVLSLILVEPANFLLATHLNRDLLAPFPWEWLWVLVGIGLTWGLIRALTVVQAAIEQWIEGVERLQALAVDRERIGRELHDGIIQSIYASGLLLESVLPIIPNDPVRAQAQLGRVMDNLNETIQDIRRYIFDLRSDMPDADLRSGIERLLRDFRINTLLETTLQITGTPVEILSMERRRHVFQIVREALANTARHAKAQWVNIQLDYKPEVLDITIADDGIGMEILLVSKGYGLRNIRERARLLDGTLRIESAPGEGVTLHLTVPIVT